MRKIILITTLLCAASAGAQIQQQSLLSTLTADSSPQQDLLTEYAAPKSRDTSRTQMLFDSYKVPDSSIVNFSIPSGLYRQLCTSCLYDTKMLQCHCQPANTSEFVTTSMQVKGCQQITASTTGQLMCLDAVKASKS